MPLEDQVNGFTIAELDEPTLKPSAPGLRAASQKVQQPRSQKALTYGLTVVIPTRNEKENVRPLLGALDQALSGISVEVIFVDDSDDETPAIIEEVSNELAFTHMHVKLEHRAQGPERVGGLATAVVLGLEIARADYVAVIDADLQHPPEQLRVFYEQALAQDLDLVLASRYIKGGGYQGLDGIGRLMISVGLKWTAKLVFPERLMRVSDPLGGFFLMRSSLLTDVTLRPIGYKILLEILLRCPWRTMLEVPYHNAYGDGYFWLWRKHAP
jgi:dolichol-phosphate mannosyltransferase